MTEVKFVGDGKVVLIAGGGRIYTDMAAKFCRSEKSINSIIASPQNLELLKNIINSNHKAALEFDDFIFGIEGFSRVTEVQLVRKRHASYMIKSGRKPTKGEVNMSVVIPPALNDLKTIAPVQMDMLAIHDNVTHEMISLKEFLDQHNISGDFTPFILYNTNTILYMIEQWYSNGLEKGIPDEELRYMKPQATEFKACIKMNAAGLRDWFQIRMCNRAQTEIRGLANEMYRLCVQAAPSLFKDSGPSCKVLGYCPEGEQCEQMKGHVPTKEKAKEILKLWNSNPE